MPDIRKTAAGCDAKPALSVGFVLTNSFTLTALATFIDALRLAADEGDSSRPIHCRWTILGSGPKPVRSSCGVEIARWEPLGNPRSFDYIVVVGGLLHAGPQVNDETVDWLRRAASQGVTLVGVCTGSFVLIRAGLMKGRRCCVSWYHHRDFVDEFPNVEPVADQLFVVDRDRITSSGGVGVADLAAYLIERHCGRAVAQKSMHILLIDKARPAREPQPQPITARDIEGERVRKALLLMEQHLSEPLSIPELAQRLNVSARQFERLFHTAVGVSPASFYRDLRLRYGLWLLRNTKRTITGIALDAGFADLAHFSRNFRAVYGICPSEIRRNQDTEPNEIASAGPLLRDGDDPITLTDRRIYL